MLICTNDGFAGIDSIDLPNKVGRSRTAFSRDFDAGAPGTGASNPALAENGVKVTVTRIG